MRKVEEYAVVPIPKQAWQEFVACFIEKCMKDQPDTPVRVVLERMIDARDPHAMDVIHALVNAAWGEISRFADSEEGDKRWKRLKA